MPVRLINGVSEEAILSPSFEPGAYKSGVIYNWAFSNRYKQDYTQKMPGGISHTLSQMQSHRLSQMQSCIWYYMYAITDMKSHTTVGWDPILGSKVTF